MLSSVDLLDPTPLAFGRLKPHDRAVAHATRRLGFALARRQELTMRVEATLRQDRLRLPYARLMKGPDLAGHRLAALTGAALLGWPTHLAKLWFSQLATNEAALVVLTRKVPVTTKLRWAASFLAQAGPVGAAAGAIRSQEDEDALRRLWWTLIRLRNTIGRTQEDLDDNPLMDELSLARALWELLNGGDVPMGIFDDLEAFAGCDAGPIREGIQSGEDYVNALLRLLNALSAMLKGFLSDELDDAFRDTLDGLSGIRAALLRLFLILLKRQIPTIQREIDAENWDAAISAMEALKQGEMGEVLEALVDGALGALRGAVEDAAENGARWAAKKLLKRLLGSANWAAAALFIIEDLALFLEAADDALRLREQVCQWNEMMKEFLGQWTELHGCMERGAVGQESVWWTPGLDGTSIKVEMFAYCFCPVEGGEPCEGTWEPTHVRIAEAGGELGNDVDIPVTPDGGSVPLDIEVPDQFECPGPCYLVARMTITTEGDPDATVVLHNFVGTICDG